MTKQTHGVPAILSFVAPGLGQIVKGELFRGVAIFIGFIINIALMVILIGLVTTPIFYLWQIKDAYSHNQ